ncbi:hypothetical protein [Caulifigura coniformis]|nr:hypothetical protein [Caulifigura coniformis]
MSDTVRCYTEVPGAELLGTGEFQTKDFGCRFDYFTIDKEGRLIHHQRTFDAEGMPLPRTPDRDVIAPIHRDVRLYGRDAVGNHRDYCARFTDGRPQWVKPWDELSELQREYSVIVES